jgi:succinate dehydrogenase / fumarate reductase iron-sulfur subunit
MVTFRVFRYDPDAADEARFDEFSFETEPGMTVLSGLYYIQEKLDPTLAFRSACRAGVCGSCAMHINGEYRLACETQIETLGKKVTIRPLAHLTIIKDMVVDLTPFWEHYFSVKPYLIPKDEPPEKEYLQSPEQRDRIGNSVDCILCAACYGSCPVALEDDSYLGPHALLKMLRFVSDSRDGADNERVAIVAQEGGVFRCHTVFNCQQVCPKDLDPSGAIAKLKWHAIGWKIKRLFGGGKIKAEVAAK